MCVCMYVSRLGMQFTQRAGYAVHTDCGSLVVHFFFTQLAELCMDNEDDEERSEHLATLDTHGHLPISDLAVKEQ